MMKWAVHSVAERRHYKNRGSAVYGYWWQFPAHILFVIIWYFLIVTMFPIAQISDAKRGLEFFVGSVEFTRPGGAKGTFDTASTAYETVQFAGAFVERLLAFDNKVPDVGPGIPFLDVHQLVNSIVLVQRRVKATDCAYDDVKPIYRKCYEDLEEHEQKEGVVRLNSGQEIAYSRRLGGFGVELPLNKETALAGFNQLLKGGFWDGATREFAIRFAFHNSPGHFTANVDISFDYSPFGRVDRNILSTFMRFEPYAPEVGGVMVFTLQIVVCVSVLAFFSLYCWMIYDQPHVRYSVARFVNAWELVELFNYIVIVLIGIMWILYLNDPRRRYKDFTSPEYQDIFPLANYFQQIIFLMAVILLTWTLRSIGLASWCSPKLERTGAIIDKVLEEFTVFGIIFFVIFMGFVLAGHVLFGTNEDRFNGIQPSAFTLFTWFVSVSNGHRNTMDAPGGALYMFAFVLIGMVLLFNMFIALVMSAHDSVAEEEANPKQKIPACHVMADAICDLLRVPKYVEDPLRMQVPDFVSSSAKLNASKSEDP